MRSTEESTTTHSPEVSVILCVFNGAETLRATMNSVLAQDGVDLELVVIDDGSTDDSWHVISEVAAADDRVRAFQVSNGGVCRARNYGMDLARADLVAFVDHDDVYLPGKLSRQLRHLREHRDLAVSSTFGWRVGASGRRLSAYDVGPTTDEQFEAMREDGAVIYLLASSVVARKQALLAAGSFRNEYRPAEDVDLWTRVADRHQVQTLPERLVDYRIHADSASSKGLFRQLEVTELIERNTLRRRAGRTELTLEEFRDLRAGRPALVKVKERLLWRSRYAYRKAGGLLADRRPQGALWLLWSFVLYPAVPIKRLRSQFAYLSKRNEERV